MELIKKVGIISIVIFVSGLFVFATTYDSKNEIVKEGVSDYFPV